MPIWAIFFQEVYFGGMYLLDTKWTGYETVALDSAFKGKTNAKVSFTAHFTSGSKIKPK
jgi:hypothetical protein